MSLRDALHDAATVLAAEPSARAQARMVGAASLKSARGENWAEADAALPALERQCIAELLALWGTLEAATLAQLGLTAAVTALPGATLAYQFDAIESLTQLLMNGEAFIAAAGTAEGPLVQKAFAAWLRGLANARAELGDAAQEVGAAARTAYRASLQQRGLELVRNGTVRTYREGIVNRLLSGDYDGMNPREVARKLRAQFDVGDYNWQRLARSEISAAQCEAKLAQYRAAGVERVNYTTANDGLVSEICIRLASAGPYALNDAPIPVRSSHPNCRCTITPVVDD